MSREHPTERDKAYIERRYPTRYHVLAYISVMVIAGIMLFIYAYGNRIVVPKLVPVDIFFGFFFILMAFIIRWDYERRGFKLFPKK